MEPPPERNNEKWNDASLVRLSGSFGDREPVCVLMTFLRANRNWIFYKWFSGELKEPPHEFRNLKDGRKVKVYVLDIPDAVLPIFLDLMWQCNVGYLIDFDLIDELYAKKHLSDYISLTTWKKLLFHYGFLSDDITINPPPAVEIPRIESPPVVAFRKCVDILISRILTMHINWVDFIDGYCATLIYQFASKKGGGIPENDKHATIVKIPGDAYSRSIPDLFTLGIIPNREVILKEQLVKFSDKLKNCNVTISSMGTNKSERYIEQFPLIHPHLGIVNGASQYDPMIDLTGTLLNDTYYLIKLYINWSK